MSDSLSSILRVHSTPGHRLAIDGPIILAVATSVDENWPLGLSAALHGLPLAVAPPPSPPYIGVHGFGGLLSNKNATRPYATDHDLPKCQAAFSSGHSYYDAPSTVGVGTY